MSSRFFTRRINCLSAQVHTRIISACCTHYFTGAQGIVSRKPLKQEGLQASETVKVMSIDRQWQVQNMCIRGQRTGRPRSGASIKRVGVLKEFSKGDHGSICVRCDGGCQEMLSKRACCGEPYAPGDRG